MTDTPVKAKAGMPLHWKMAIGFALGLVLGLAVHMSVGGDAPWVQTLTTYLTTPFSKQIGRASCRERV